MADFLTDTALQDEDFLLSFSAVSSKLCPFPPPIFEDVMLNLIKNPNITSSHLFRADIFYDSENDLSYTPIHDAVSWKNGNVELCNFAKHMKEDYRPRPVKIRGWNMKRTIVREMIPRNPQLDKPLAQTCCLYEQSADYVKQEGIDAINTDALSGREEHSSRYLVVYVPHALKETDIPYYHPKVRSLAFMYEWRTRHGVTCVEGSLDSFTEEPPEGLLSIFVAPFGDMEPAQYPHIPPTLSPSASSRLTRTIRNLLNTISRHGTGRLNGYTKRVNHDQIISQPRLQDTYTRLKLKYAYRLSSNWQEATDPTKHVFEDLGIAAWLMELWRDMYGIDPDADSETKYKQADASGFGGFVDIGCGNGLLVALLRWECYDGWGFDIRRRKSWDEFEKDESVNGRLKERVLIPKIFGQSDDRGPRPMLNGKCQLESHDGIFPPSTFIISNHADELTTWTPLLAHLSSNTPFVAIPCCSHDLSGVRTRFSPQKPKDERTANDSANPSAYQTLCDYVERMTAEVDYIAQREYLRIPSTRNIAILGLAKDFRWHRNGRFEGHNPSVSVFNETETHNNVINILRTELKEPSLEAASQAWRQRAEKLRSMKGNAGH